MNIKKMVDKNEAKAYKELYSTLVGSIVSTIGILKGKTHWDNYKEFKRLYRSRHKLPQTVAELCKYVDENYGEPTLVPCLRKKLVLVYSENEFWAPMVTLADSDGMVLPIAPDGLYYGILAEIGRDEVKIEDNIYE